MADIRERELATDLLAGLLMEQAQAQTSLRQRDRLTLKTYAVMAATTAVTFATLLTGYQTFFVHQLFA